MKQTRIFGKTPTGEYIDAKLDTNKNLKADLATQIAGEDVDNDRMKMEFRYGYTNMNSLTTTNIKASAGVLHGITLNNPGTSWEVDIYDGNTTTAGTRIGTFRSPIRNISVPYDMEFLTGLTIDAEKGTTAGDLTVSYR